MYIDLYSDFVFKSTTIEQSSHGNQTNIVCTEFTFVGILTILPCIPYFPYPFNWNICAKAKGGVIKCSSIFFNIDIDCKFNALFVI